jgi:exonuclease SbcD
MRIVHTSDWHAGRLWKNQNRLDELQAVLEHLGDFVERERIDLLLMSGDIFESQMPSADAERAVSTFFKRLGRAGVPSVVIAGNHDHCIRLDTWGLLAEFVGVHARGLPRRRQDGGLIEVPTRSGHTALVAALPWAPPGRIVEALTLAQDETLAKQQYADGMQRILAHLAEGFRTDAVNLVVAHSHVAGATGSGSERVMTMGEEWMATAQSLPPAAQYVALGHIHRPQRVVAAASHTEYAGSPLQLDFGEAGEEKSFVVIDLAPGLPPKVERVPYQGGRCLGTWEGTLPELEQQAVELKRFGFLRVTVTLDTPMPDLNRRARQILPNIVVVDAVLPETSPGPGPGPDPVGPQPPVEQFRAYYLRAHQRPPQPATVDLFNELYQSASTE